MNTTWKCPRCKRAFRQANQRHSCGVGDQKALLRNKSEHLVSLYRSLENILKSYRGVEIVAKDRYALFRTVRIFADLVFMRDALRLAVHLKQRVSASLFFKVVQNDNGRVTHVAKLYNVQELAAIGPFLKEA